MNTVHTLSFIQDLAIIMLIAGVITVLCHRFKQPAVLGYIIAGIIIGPHTPPFTYIQNLNTIKTLAELGVIFLMFSLGLEFDLAKLKKVGFTAFVAAFIEIVIMMWVGYELGHLFGWSNLDSIFLGAILAISSTTIIIKALEDLNLKREKFARLIFGILIIEDIFAIAILALLSGIATSGTFQITETFHTTLELLSFLVISLVAGILIVPRVLSYVAKFHNREMLLISVLGFCFGFCLLVIKLHYSVALGAFVIGMIIAESRQLKLIEQLIASLRDMFSAIFFVSVGLLFNPEVLVKYYLPIIVITLAVIIGKVISCSVGTFIAGSSLKTSTRVGMGLAQIGEFSFIIASLGISLKVTSDFIFPIAVAVSAITTFLTPYLIKSSDTFTQTMINIMPNPILNFTKWYSRSIRKLQSRNKTSELKKVVNRGLLQIIINFFIVTAIFYAAVHFAKTEFVKNFVNIINVPSQKIIIWGLAVLFSWAFLVALYRKIKALSMMGTDFFITDTTQNLNKVLRAVIPEIISILCLSIILLFIFLLSISILPNFKSMLLVIIVLTLVTTIIYPSLIKIHAKLQIKLFETMSKKRR